MMKLHLACLSVPRVRCLVVRKTLTSLTASTLVSFREKVAAEALAAGLLRFYGGSQQEPASYRYANGSVLVMGGCDKATAFLSTEYDLAFADEAIELTPDDVETIDSRLRNGRLPYQQFLLATNPGAPTHFLKNMERDGRLVILYSKHEDNPLLHDGREWTKQGKTYLERLDGLSGARYHRLRWGRWVASEGMIYGDEWDESIHHVPWFKPPDSWEVWWSIDFGFCVDEDTEILTGAGWKSLDEVGVGDRCLSFSLDTGTAEWDDVLKVSVFPAKPREMIEMRSLSHSSLTTPNHRWPCRHNRSGHLRFRTTDGFVQADMVPTAAPVADLPTDPKFTDALVELVAWYWTEGSRWRAGSGSTRGVNTGGFISQNRGPETDRIRAALIGEYGPPSATMREGTRAERIPKWRDWTPRSNAGQGNDTGTFHLNGPALAPILEWVDGPDKIVRPEFIASLTRAQLDLFIKTSLDADGYVASRKSGTLGISQACRARLDSFQMACQLAGYATVLRGHSRGKVRWHSLTIFVKYRQFQPWSKREQRMYGGRIWCPTTRNGTWLARRNGTVYFTGNTNPMSVQNWAEDPDGRLYLYREIYHTRRTVDQHCDDILACVATPDPSRPGRWIWHERKPRGVICDHDAEGREVFRQRTGLSTRPAKKGVADGIQAVQKRLRLAGDGKPRLYIMHDTLVRRDQELVDARLPTCTVEEIPGYVWAKPGTSAASKAPKEVPLKENDHGMDGKRYMCAEREQGPVRVRILGG
jgi:hypothetical protein